MCTAQCAPYIPLAAVPALLWLLFFTSQKVHREKIRNILYIFFWGIFIAAPVVVVQALIEDILYTPFASYALASTLYAFLGIAFVEEAGKYLVVKLKAVPRAFFDEPQDAIIYMITAGLGFAAIENMVYAAGIASSLREVIELAAFRGITATFLHASASAVLGYFLAISIFDRTSEHKKFIFIGLTGATVLHGIYNNFIMNITDIVQQFECTPFGEQGCPESLFGVTLIALLLISSGIIITVGLHKLTKIQFNN